MKAIATLQNGLDGRLRLSLLLAVLMSLAAIFQSRPAHPSSAQPNTTACSKTERGVLAYVVFDQSPQSALFFKEMESLACPTVVAINQVRGNFSATPSRSERHPLAFVFEASGKVRQFDDPKAFVSAVNSAVNASAQIARHATAPAITKSTAYKQRVNATGDLGKLHAP